MDIYRLMNSRDIATHCRNINYSFNVKETAFIIHNAYDLTMNERHEAFAEIIKVMSDINNEADKLKNTSFHARLRRYVDLEKRLMTIFETDNDGSVYRYGYYCEMHGGEIAFVENETIFDRLANVQRDIQAARSSREYDDKVFKFIIAKKWLNGNKYIRVIVAPDGKLLACSANGVLALEDELFHSGLFEHMWVKIPTPFKRGDIVIGSTPMQHGTTEYGHEPFVLENICHWKNENGVGRAGSDSMDMTAGGYFVNKKGRVYSECMHAYQNLEFFRGELSGNQRILAGISNYIKGKIDVELLLNSHAIIRSEEYLRDICADLHGYTDEDVRLAGL
ncbi:hypothetical protein M2149_001833 [Lachnospiraceae bacterium PFB1-21]